MTREEAVRRVAAAFGPTNPQTESMVDALVALGLASFRDSSYVRQQEVDLLLGHDDRHRPLPHPLRCRCSASRVPNGIFGEHVCQRVGDLSVKY
jgi:hypothetical protein